MSKARKSHKSRAAARKAAKPQTQNPPTTFAELHAALIADHRPANDEERDIVARLTKALWQSRRCRVLEEVVLEHGIQSVKRQNPGLSGAALEGTGFLQAFTIHPRIFEFIGNSSEHYLDLECRLLTELQFLQAQRFNQGQGSQRFEVELRNQKIM